MSKGVDRSVYLGGLTKLATGTRVTFCSAQPANFAGIASVLLASKAITAASGALVDNTANGAYTVAPDGSSGYKLTVAAQTNMTPSANGTINYACIDDGTTLLSWTTVTAQAVTTAQSWGSPAFSPWDVGQPT